MDIREQFIELFSQLPKEEQERIVQITSLLWPGLGHEEEAGRQMNDAPEWGPVLTHGLSQDEIRKLFDEHKVYSRKESEELDSIPLYEVLSVFGTSVLPWLRDQGGPGLNLINTFYTYEDFLSIAHYANLEICRREAIRFMQKTGIKWC